MKSSIFIPLLGLFFLGQSASAMLVLNAPMTITHKVQVQPIIVSQEGSEGGEAATFFGTPGQQAIIEGFVDDIWAQAGVDVEFLPTNSYVSSFAYDGFPLSYPNTGAASDMPRPTGDLAAINSGAGSPPKNTNLAVLNMFFVDVVPGFEFTTENTANGLAFVDGNGVAQFVGDNLLSFTLGQEVIAKVVAHEIGHNLGLHHQLSDGTEDNLMHSPGSASTGERLTAAQKTTIFDDGSGSDGFELLQPIPEPSGIAFGLLALMVLGSRRRRR